ncbi:MAG: succinate dehydrogenase, cytochrome b556 subunit [Gammaproteobacteria bacterium]|nr:succinate dehydrogenase, cytochrome b556 subunit [Gammaproteobacteria bacterium]
MTAPNTKRPVFLSLTRIHFPVMAVLSLGHRLSGVLLVLSVPLLAYLFDRSLVSAEGYAGVIALPQDKVARIFLLLLAWAFAHHLLAGIRYLLIDLDVGVTLRGARASAWAVLAGGVVAMLGAALLLP